MRAKILSLVLLGGLVAAGFVVAPEPAQGLELVFPSLELKYVDLKVKDADLCYDPISGELYVDVDIKNKGNLALSGSVRIDVWVYTEDRRVYRVTRSVSLNLAAGGEEKDIAMPSVLPNRFSNKVTVLAWVDYDPKWYSAWWIYRGAWWEGDELNNNRYEWFVYRGPGYCYDEA